MVSSYADDVIRLKHIVDAINESLDFVKSEDRNSLNENRMLTLALIKQLELIGEAANRVSTEFQHRFAQIPWRNMVATRNRLIHGYFEIDLDIVWNTVDRDLRGLRPILLAALEDLGG